MCIPPSVRTPPSALTLAQWSQTRIDYIDYIVHSPPLVSTFCGRISNFVPYRHV